MIATAIQGDEPAPTKRRSLLLVDADPLLRWSIVIHLGTAFDIQIAKTHEEGRGLLMRQRFDAVILSNECRAKAIRELEVLAKLKNVEVTIVRLTTRMEDRLHEPGIQFLEKPFELASLSNALGAGST